MSQATDTSMNGRAHPLSGLVIAALLPLPLLLLFGLWAAGHAGRWPERLAVHWGVHGPDRWIGATAASVLTMLGLTALTCLLLAAVGLSLLLASARTPASNAAEERVWRFRRLGTLLLIACEYFTLVPPVCSLTAAPWMLMRIWSLALAATLIGFMIALLRAAVLATRAVAASHGAGAGDGAPGRCWYGGVFYFNRHDPALWVGKRIGIGWTLNFAHRWSWLVLAALLAVPLLLGLLAAHASIGSR